jgi:hypothetical protein
MTLTPAYGRDYDSKSAVLADFIENKDFTLQPDERPINRTQVEGAGESSVRIRYHRLTRVVEFVLRNGIWALS